MHSPYLYILHFLMMCAELGPLQHTHIRITDFLSQISPRRFKYLHEQQYTPGLELVVQFIQWLPNGKSQQSSETKSVAVFSSF